MWIIKVHTSFCGVIETTRNTTNQKNTCVRQAKRNGVECSREGCEIHVPPSMIKWISCEEVTDE